MTFLIDSIAAVTVERKEKNSPGMRETERETDILSNFSPTEKKSLSGEKLYIKRQEE